MTTMQRFILDSATLAGAVSMAGIDDVGDSGLPGPARPNQRKLGSAGALDGTALQEDFAAALDVMAHPTRVLAVTASGAGRPDWVVTRLVPSPASDAVVAWAKRGDDYDIAVLGARSAAVLLVDELLKLTDLPTSEPNARYDLSVSGYVALLAASDVMQRVALQNRLDRKIRQAPPTLDAASAADLVRLGIREPDTRWAVSAGALTSPSPFPADETDLTAGLDELRQVGIVTGRPGEVRLSATGIALSDALTRIINLGSLELSFHGGATAARVTMFRCMAAIWSAVWGYGPDGTTRVTLLELDHRSALGIIEDLLDQLTVVEPASVPAPAAAAAVEPTQDDRFCSKCGAEYKAGSGFCTSCGAVRA